MINTTEIFPWNDYFATGIPQVDEQHYRLVQRVNLLAQHIANQSDAATLNQLLTELFDYATDHFQSEENLWSSYFPGAPLSCEHQAAHHRFIACLSALKAEETHKPPQEIVAETLAFLSHWLAVHILENDKRMTLAVLGVQSGLSVTEAQQQAEREMGGATKTLIEIILVLYENLSRLSTTLIKETMVRQQVENQLRLSSNVFENTLDAICITDAETQIIDINPAFCRISELSREQLLGQNLKTLMSGFNDQHFASNLWDKIHSNGHWSGEIQNSKPGIEQQTEWLTLSSIKDEQNTTTHYVAVFSNVSQLLQRQRKLERIANHDPLTKLPNRNLLRDRLELSIAFAKRTGDMLAICYLDLDGFKPVNDQHGHDAGDQVLCVVSQRIKGIVRDNDTAARMGGDEFVILLGQIKAVEDCRIILDRLLNDIAAPIQIGNEKVYVTASIGVALFPIDGKEAEVLLKRADKAMYLAKKSGKSRYHF